MRPRWIVTCKIIGPWQAFRKYEARFGKWRLEIFNWGTCNGRRGGWGQWSRKWLLRAWCNDGCDDHLLFDEYLSARGGAAAQKAAEGWLKRFLAASRMAVA